jgi:predicted amidohydrolase
MLPEGLTSEPKTITLLCGTTARLGVLICADLNDSRLPARIQAAGANVLLVPALTPHEGAFVGAVSMIASFCQGVAAVVNGSPPGMTRLPLRRPFMLLLARPDPAARRQVLTVGRIRSRRASAVINLRRGRVRWLSFS